MDSPKRTHSGSEEDSGRRTPIQKNWARFNDSGLATYVQMSGFSDVEEIGWGDSPEPLKIDCAYKPPKEIAPNETPPSCRKMSVRQSARAALSLAVDHDLEIIKKIKQRFLTKQANQPSDVIHTPSSTQTSASTVINPSTICVKDINSNSAHCKSVGCNLSPFTKTDHNSSGAQISKLSTECANDFKSLLDDDEDVWLSQIDLGQSCSTPQRSKNSLTKSRSENQLDSPSPGRSGSFRRSYSFQPSIEQPSRSSAGDRLTEEQPQPLKKQKSFHIECLPGKTQCSAEQIEQKRLQAIYRREHREIERRKQAALQRLNERRARLAAESTKR